MSQFAHPRPALPASLLLASLVLLHVGCGHGGAAAANEEASAGAGAAGAAASAPVRLATVRAASGVVARLAAISLSTPAHAAALAAPVPGRVVAVEVAEGDRVEAGAPLVRLRSPARIAARAHVASATRQLEVVRARLAQVVRLQHEGLADGGQRFELERTIASLQADIEIARADLRAAASVGCEPNAAITGDDQRSDDLWLCAPIAGVVAEVAARTGAAVDAGSGALVVLSAPGPLRVQVERFEPLPAAAALAFVVPGGAAVGAPERVPLAAAPLSSRVAAERGSVFAVHLAQPVTASFAGVRGVVEVEVADGVLAAPRDAVAMRDGQLCAFRVAGPGEPMALPVEVLGAVGAEVLVRPLAPTAGDQGPLRAGDSVLAVAPGLSGGEGD